MQAQVQTMTVRVFAGLTNRDSKVNFVVDYPHPTIDPSIGAPPGRFVVITDDEGLEDWARRNFKCWGLKQVEIELLPVEGAE